MGRPNRCASGSGEPHVKPIALALRCPPYIAVWTRFPIADPIVGLGISALIAKIVYDSAKSVFGRMLDGVDPDVLETLEHEVLDVPGVRSITYSRARWIRPSVAR